MYAFVIVIHLIVCIVLIAIILVQRRQGGGLIESFSNFESVFGAKTNVFLNRLTTVFAVLFLTTCLLLAFISAQKSRSLLEKSTGIGIPTQTKTTESRKQLPPPEEVPKTEAE